METTSQKTHCRTYYFIDEKEARRAKESYSFSTYEEGSTSRDYKATVDSAYKLAETVTAQNPEVEEKAFYMADQFSKRLANWINRENTITASVPSVMIAGPSNFPTTRKEKQTRALRKHYEVYEEIKKYVDRIEGLGSGGIRTDDKNAQGLIEKKIATLTERRETGKLANKYYAKYKTLVGFTFECKEQKQKLERELKENVVYAGKPGPSYWLSNLGANIRRLEGRLTEISRLREKKPVDFYPQQTVCTVTENVEANRIQLVFEGKPSEHIRELLKHHAYKWSPKNKVWQRQMTTNARYDTIRLLDLFKMIETKTQGES